MVGAEKLARTDEKPATQRAKRAQARPKKPSTFVPKITKVEGPGGVVIVPFNPPKRD